ncbi:ABC transporter ATP-binding protein [Streptomyces albidoflavus]
MTPEAATPEAAKDATATLDAAVVVEDLVKEYLPGMPPAVDGLSFSVARGEVFGLLGPNGAGKTTTIRMLTTMAKATSGRAFLDGIDVVAHPDQARGVLAIVPQHNNLDRSLTVRQNLLFHAAYHGIGRSERRRRADELLERVQLTDRADSLVDEMSGGQAQRVMIARALMHDPSVMFLDEPATGLDPQARLFVHDLVVDLGRQGVTVVITTHDMEEAAKLCDRIGIVDHGKLLTLGTPEELIRDLPGGTTLTLKLNLLDETARSVTDALTAVPWVAAVEYLPGAPAVPPPFPGMPAPEPEEERFVLSVESGAGDVLPPVFKVLGELRCEVKDLAVREASLEDVFIHLTGRGLR